MLFGPKKVRLHPHSYMKIYAYACCLATIDAVSDSLLASPRCCGNLRETTPAVTSCITRIRQAELLAAKAKFADLNGGVPYDPPKPAKKAKGPAKTPAPERAPGEKSKKVRLERERALRRENGMRRSCSRIVDKIDVRFIFALALQYGLRVVARA